MRKLFSFKGLSLLLGLLLLGSVFLFNAPGYVSRRAAGEIEGAKEAAMAAGYSSGFRDGSDDAFIRAKDDAQALEASAYAAGMEAGKREAASKAWAEGYETGRLDGVSEAKAAANASVPPATEAAPVKSAAAIPPSTEAPVRSAREVYVSRKGIYHSYPTCSGMKYYTAMSIDDALSAGYRACKKCW